MWPISSGGSDDVTAGGFGDFVSGGALGGNGKIWLGLLLFLAVVLVAYYWYYLYPTTRFDGDWSVTLAGETVASHTCTLLAGPKTASGGAPITVTCVPIADPADAPATAPPAAAMRARMMRARVRARNANGANTGSMIDGVLSITVGTDMPMVAGAKALKFGFLLSTFKVKGADGNVLATAIKVKAAK